jgi:hypothetical protein
MKKLILIALLSVAACWGKAQTTKADFEAMFTQMGTSVQKIEKLWVGNEVVFFNDNTWDRRSTVYLSSNKNTFELTATGFKVVHAAGTPECSIVMYPYDKIKSYSAGMTFVNISLVD